MTAPTIKSFVSPKVYPTMRDALEDLRSTFYTIAEHFQANVDFQTFSFFAHNLGDDFVISEIENDTFGMPSADALQANPAYIHVEYPDKDNLLTVPATIGDKQALYKIPAKIVLLRLPRADEVLKTNTGSAKKFVKAAILAAMRRTATTLTRDSIKKGLSLPKALADFATIPDSASYERAYKTMFKTLQYVIVQNAAQQPEVAAHVNAQTVTASNLRAAFESQRTAEALYPSIEARHWDALLQRAAQIAPTFTREFVVKDENGKSVKDADGNVMREVRADPQNPAIFMHWLETRHEQLENESVAKLAEMDFGSFGGSEQPAQPSA